MLDEGPLRLRSHHLWPQPCQITFKSGQRWYLAHGLGAYEPHRLVHPEKAIRHLASSGKLAAAQIAQPLMSLCTSEQQHFSTWSQTPHCLTRLYVTYPFSMTYLANQAPARNASIWVDGKFHIVRAYHKVLNALTHHLLQ